MDDGERTAEHRDEERTPTSPQPTGAEPPPVEPAAIEPPRRWRTMTDPPRA